jgi:hypothetical protein
MKAWNNAVILNTAAGYRAFLAQFPDSDLAPTARKLEERLRNRPNFVATVATGGGAPATSGVAASGPAGNQPTNAALGPTCPCTTPILPQKKVETPKKRTEPDPPRRVDRAPPRYIDDDVVVVRRPPPDYYAPRGPSVGIGIGGSYGGGGGNYGSGAPVGGYQGRTRGGY